MDEVYMQRCLQLAANGAQTVVPNPMVGCVIVLNDTIIGEGWHRAAGEPHAEVNAINAVRDKTLLTDATAYVSLEPCAHYGRTPPCADLLIKHKLKRVVIACKDAFAKVNGAGIEKLQSAGIDVTVGVLEKEALELNRVFFGMHQKKRPFITLKWAQTLDGFYDKERTPSDKGANWITSADSKTKVHELRATCDAILVGSNTALVDNPSLTTRLVDGKSPLRLVLDRNNRISKNAHLFTDRNPTVLFTHQRRDLSDTVEQQMMLPTENPIKRMLNYCYQNNLQHLLVEGGAALQQQFITQKLWDEAQVFVGAKTFGTGLKAPLISGKNTSSRLGVDTLLTYVNT